MQNLDHAHGLLLHFNHEAIDQCAEMAPENHSRDGDNQAKTGVVKRHRDAVSQLQRIGSGG